MAMTDILVIEDETSLRQLVVEALKISGYSAVGAADGLEGLDMLRRDRPDLVLCDITMPELDGYEVLREIRSDPSTQTLPVVFLTALGSREDMRRGMELGADDFLVKPFATQELLATVNTQLRKQAAVSQKIETTLRLARRSIVYALPHELRTPLFGITGFAQLLKLDYATLPPDTVLEYSENILRSCTRLERLIENFLVYAQIEMIAGDPERLEEVNSHFIRHSDEIIASAAQKAAVAQQRVDDLRLDLCSVSLRIAADNLSKIVYELVDNAFKFSTPGAVVVVSAVTRGDTFTLSVRDRGRGMTREQIESVGPFVQFDRMLHEQQGMGLGLAIAFHLTGFHGGDLHIQSEVGVGTLVSVDFRYR